MIAEILGLIAGIAAHQTKPLIDDLDTDSQTVRNLSSYAVGYLSIGVVFEVSLVIHSMDAPNRQRARAAFWLSGVFVGIGVFVGYVLDSLKATKKPGG